MHRMSMVNISERHISEAWIRGGSKCVAATTGLSVQAASRLVSNLRRKSPELFPRKYKEGARKKSAVARRMLKLINDIEYNISEEHYEALKEMVYILCPSVKDNPQTAFSKYVCDKLGRPIPVV